MARERALFTAHRTAASSAVLLSAVAQPFRSFSMRFCVWLLYLNMHFVSCFFSKWDYITYAVLHFSFSLLLIVKILEIPFIKSYAILFKSYMLSHRINIP